MAGDGFLSGYWGPTGHFAIAQTACGLVEGADLRDFFRRHEPLITPSWGPSPPDDPTIFQPLADVPDHIWKQHAHPYVRPHEKPNHWAEIDRLDADGASLLDRMRRRPVASMTMAAWLDFYAHTTPPTSAKDMGLVPFRVAQLYRLAVDSLRAGDDVRGFTAAGVMAHYVGDACQPLHLTVNSDDPKGVHEAYEGRMVDAHQHDIRSAVLSAKPPDGKRVVGDKAVLRLMGSLMVWSCKTLAPATISAAYAAGAHDADALWERFGPQTNALIVRGSETLAVLWSSIWAEAGTPPPTATITQADVQALYLDAAFAPSLYLTELSALQPAARAQPAGSRPR
jgi:hypothetical protein